MVVKVFPMEATPMIGFDYFTKTEIFFDDCMKFSD